MNYLLEGKTKRFSCFYHTILFYCTKNIRLNSTHYFIIKIPIKRELQQIPFNYSLDIDVRDFMNLYKKCTEKPYSSLVIDSTFASDNLLRFRKNLVDLIQKLIITIDKIRDEKLQYDINRETAKISSGKTDKYEYLAGEEILPSDQRRVIEQATFTYSHLGKDLEKQLKTIEDKGKKQIKAIEGKYEKQLADSNALVKK